MAADTQLDARNALDTRVEIITPENIAFQYRIAGPFRRLPAYLLDLLIRAVLLLAVVFTASVVFGSLGAPDLAVGITLVTWFVLAWFYGGLFETFWNGQTPGKYLMRLRVLTVDGEPITAWQAILRNILRAADALPTVVVPGLEWLPPLVPVYMFGFFSALATSRYQRLGDLVAGTMVVVEQRDLLRGVMPVADRDVIELAGRLPAGFRAGRSLARALASYVDRRRFFSAARREEMARPLGMALADRYQLPPLASYDQLLCALYYRSSIADRAQSSSEEPVAAAREPISAAAELEDFLVAAAGETRPL